MTDDTPVGRRVVLGMLGLGAVGVLAGGRLSDLLSPVTGLGGSWRFYNVTDRTPVRSRATWRLRVGGLVATPSTLTFADLQRLPQRTLTSDFQCVTGWRVPHVHWAGVRLGDVLDAAGVSARARAVHLTSYDGTYTESLTLEQARRPDVLLAHTMNGDPLSVDHGGPVRLLVAPMYGYKSLKWLGGVTAGRTVVPGFWEGFGYDVDAWVGRSNGRTDAPTGSGSAGTA